MTDIVERLRPDDSTGPCCPFCRRDPYHYVDIGVGYQAAAVECCELGIGLFQYGDEQLVEIAGRMAEAATEIERLRAENQRLRQQVADLERAVLKAAAPDFLTESEREALRDFVQFLRSTEA